MIVLLEQDGETFVICHVLVDKGFGSLKNIFWSGLQSIQLNSNSYRV